MSPAIHLDDKSPQQEVARDESDSELEKKADDFPSLAVSRIFTQVTVDKKELRAVIDRIEKSWIATTDLAVNQDWKVHYKTTGKLELPKLFRLQEAYDILRNCHTSFQLIQTLLITELELPAEKAKNGQKEIATLEETPTTPPPSPQTIINTASPPSKPEKDLAHSAYNKIVQVAQRVIRPEQESSHHIMMRHRVKNLLEEMKQIQPEWMHFWNIYPLKTQWLEDCPIPERYEVEQLKFVRFLSKMNSLVIAGSEAYVALRNVELNKDRMRMASKALTMQPMISGPVYSPRLKPERVS